MPLHLIKLCVGATSLDDLRDWIALRHAQSGRKGPAQEHVHVTRMMPKRREELLSGGSLYWVIRGMIACRQTLIDLRPVQDDAGISHCAIVMKPELITVSPRPYRPFQGWRYLRPDDAPPDADGTDAMPDDLKRRLAGMGLL